MFLNGFHATSFKYYVLNTAARMHHCGIERHSTGIGARGLWYTKQRDVVVSIDTLGSSVVDLIIPT